MIEISRRPRTAFSLVVTWQYAPGMFERAINVSPMMVFDALLVSYEQGDIL